MGNTFTTPGRRTGAEHNELVVDRSNTGAPIVHFSYLPVGSGETRRRQRRKLAAHAVGLPGTAGTTAIVEVTPWTLHSQRAQTFLRSLEQGQTTGLLVETVEP